MDAHTGRLIVRLRNERTAKERAAINRSVEDCPLPSEILLMIIDCYISERHQELVGLRRKQADLESLGVDMRKFEPPHWPIVPLLQTAKFFRVEVIPRLYKKVTLLQGRTFEEFCSKPALTSYKLVKELYANAPDYLADGWIDYITHHRHLAMLCAEAASNALFRSPGDLDDLEKFVNLWSHWVEDLRPNFEVLTVRNCRMHNLKDLSKL